MERQYSIKRDRLLIEELEEDYILHGDDPTPYKFRSRIGYNSIAFNMLMRYFAYSVYGTSEDNMNRVLKYGGFYEYWNNIWVEDGNINRLTVGDVMSYCDPYGLMNADEGGIESRVSYNGKTIRSLYLVGDGETYETKYLYPPKLIKHGAGDSN